MGGQYSKPDIPIKWYNDYVAAMPSQEGKNVAITGCTSGTGLETAKAIASRGGNIFALNRPSERATASLAAMKEACKDGGTATHIDCDLQDYASVRFAASQVKNAVQAKGLHCLLNNAGVMALPEQATKDNYDVQMQTNHLSHFLLTSLLMPDLEKAAVASGEARVVNHSSSARNGMDESSRRPLDAKYFEPSSSKAFPEYLTGSGFRARWARYQQTKLCNTVFTLALKDKLGAKGSKVKSLVCHPGGAATNLQATTAASGKGNGVNNRMFSFIASAVSQSAADGALPLLACAVASDAESGDFYVPGKEGFASKMIQDTVVGPPKKLDWVARAKREEHSTSQGGRKLLWDCSEKAIGQSFF